MKKLTGIPFNGFYESEASETIDGWVEQELEEYEGEQGAGLTFNPIPDLNTYVWSNIKLMSFYKEYAKIYAASFFDWFNSETGLDIKPSEEIVMTSPKEYNFTTDTIDVNLAPSDVKKLRKYVRESCLVAVIIDKFTSYDGFISFYSNDLYEKGGHDFHKTWPKDLLKWDHNQIQTLIEACIKTAGVEIPRDSEIMEQERWSEVESLRGEVSGATLDLIEGFKKAA